MIYIEVTASGLVVSAGGFTAEVKMFSGKGFPTMENLDDVSFHAVNRLQFIEALNLVKYALPAKDFSGIAALKMINIKGGKFTACDGSRFQQTRIDGFNLNMQLPSEDIVHLIKMLSATDMELLEIGEVDKKLIFRLGNTAMYINKLNDPYPNVEQLWLRPALSNDQELIIDRQELITAIKQVRTVADVNSDALALILDTDSVRIVVKDINNNSAHSTIAGKWVGKPRNVVVNYLHLAEMLKAYPGKECKFLLGSDSKERKSPLLLRDDETLALATISQKINYQPDLTA